MIRVLLVEDNAADARLVSLLLAEDSDAKFDLVHVDRVGVALQRLLDESFDAILLDLGLPDAAGLEAADRVLDGFPDIPVIVMSGLNDEDLAVRAVQNGAQDYLIKGRGDGSLVSRSIRYAIERKRSEQYINHIANHDGLTGLPNRRLLKDRLDQGLARSRRNRRILGVAFLDLDNFKAINDTLGHPLGDRLLQSVADRLRRAVRESDTVARWGGDEFSLVLPEVVRLEDLAGLAAKVLEALRTPFRIDSHDIFVSASLGISSFPADGDTPDMLLKNADVAMYRAKHLGRNGYEFYSPALNNRAGRRLAMDTALRYAVQRHELQVHFQPMVKLRTWETAGFEALLRWSHPEWGLLTPADFIPLAEETGLIVPIGEWVLDEGCRQIRAWTEAGFGPIRLAVNLSGRQFGDRNLLPAVKRAVESHRIDPGALELELTESTLMRGVEEADRIIQSLKSLGVQVSIDDFGTGYSSLSRLSEFRIDTLKIDRSFIDGLSRSGGDRVIVEAVIAMGHALNLKVIAEGVERDDQLAFLVRHGCDQSQGYFFSRPLPVDRASLLLESPPDWNRTLSMPGNPA